MNRREDLLELTPQALTALANAGFVKRAQREVAAGQLPTLTIDDQGVVTAVFDDGVETRFPPGVGLHDAPCNCPASGMCRHRVTLVLAWQAGFHAAAPENQAVASGTADSAGAETPAVDASAASPSGDAAAARAAAPSGDGASAAAGTAGLGPSDAATATSTAGSKAAAPAAPAAALASAPASTPAAAARGAAQAESFSPADFDDAALSTALGATALAQATRFAAQQPTVRVQPWQGAESPPIARLPMCTVRFFSRHNLQLARCDCVAGGRCAHVALAVWAFRQARPEAGGDERVLTLRGPVPFGAGAKSGAGAAPVADESLDSAKGKSGAVSKATAQKTGDEAEYSVKDAQGDGFGLRSEGGLRARTAIDALLTQLWLDGAGQPQLALAGRFTALRVELQALNWQWVLDALDELEAQIHALAARSTRFDPLRLLDLSAELWARCRAAEHQWQQASQTGGHAGSHAAHQALPAAEVLGRGVRGEVALDHLRLVSLGGNLWSDVHAEGASVFLADPDTQSVLVLAREWPKGDADASGASAGSAGSGPMPVPVHGAPGSTPAQTSLLQRRVVGVPLRQLLESQVVTKASKRRANGVVDIGGNKRQTGVLPLSATAWTELSPPLCQPGIAALGDLLARQIPAFVAPRHAASGAAVGVSGNLHVLRLQGAQLLDWHWDGAAQCVHATWLEAAAPTHAQLPSAAELLATGGADEGGVAVAEAAPAVLRLSLRYTPEAPGAVDGLAKALAGDFGPVLAVAGPAWLSEGAVCMQPTAIVCAQRAVALAAFAPAPQAMPSSAGDEAESVRGLALRSSLAHLGQLLRDGVRHQGGMWPQTVGEHAQLLRRAGFAQAGGSLAAMPELAQGAQRERLLPEVSRLSLLLRELQA